ncbi:Gfo/Idh/MocA family oxidoreductase [Rhodohalobacter sp. 614A]|uniref:Gfo/Idh/MocA family oxidoreductase n=1 Tax=Rhodohalobacter sp. 614A TaxID=2908649 RepID=UPI001F2E222D|nr:Gfo/Idh/MocA family oxidoreductase [Rhodohalobacter sp. 614A]
MNKFALTGLAGYIAERHLKAIQQTGNNLVAAVDPHDSVGIIDSYFPDASFFTEVERFDRHLEKLRRRDHNSGIDYLSICTPNHLHDAHIRMALRLGADAICEKPLVLNPWNLDILQELEEEYKQRVWTILQLRVHPGILALKKKLTESKNEKRHQVRLTYITSRGLWYYYSWKGEESKSGGIGTNIGIHFFDLLMWLFGEPTTIELHIREKNRLAGFLELPNADVEWFLSLEKQDVPTNYKDKRTFRSITVDGKEIEFSGRFDNLHTKVYEETLMGRGFGISDARPSVELVHKLRTIDVTQKPVGLVHPGVERLNHLSLPKQA